MKSTVTLMLWLCFNGMAMAGYNPDMVAVEHPGNPADANGRGGVKYTFRITDRNISNKAYAMFLNAADPQGNNLRNLYNPKMSSHPQGGILFDASAKPGVKYRARENLKDSPVRFVNWLDAARFANWLNNGGRKGSSTEVGAYNLRKSGGRITSREKESAFWIPSSDELYKAAYFLLEGRWMEHAVITGAEDPLPRRGASDTAIKLIIAAGKIFEIVDVSIGDSPAPVNTDSGLLTGSGAPDFSGSLDPLAESDQISFFIAGVSDSRREEDRKRGDAIYAGAPANVSDFSPFSFGGSGGGGPSAEAVSQPIAELPPAS